ncbi:hypothetical protein ACFTAO_07505 [Paenibacillus rhizoplanae]
MDFFTKYYPTKILQPIEELEITDIVRKASIDGLSEAMRSVAQANGGNTGGLVLDLDISEDAINTLFKSGNKSKNTKLKTIFLSEASQGLGYSNMIFLFFFN